MTTFEMQESLVSQICNNSNNMPRKKKQLPETPEEIEAISLLEKTSKALTQATKELKDKNAELIEKSEKLAKIKEELAGLKIEPNFILPKKYTDNVIDCSIFRRQNGNYSWSDYSLILELDKEIEFKNWRGKIKRQNSKEQIVFFKNVSSDYWPNSVEWQKLEKYYFAIKKHIIQKNKPQNDLAELIKEAKEALVTADPFQKDGFLVKFLDRFEIK